MPSPFQKILMNLPVRGATATTNDVSVMLDMCTTLV